MRHLLSAVTLFLAATCATVSLAEVKVPPVFSDHMVLQRDLAAPVWGTAEAGEEVAVSIAGQSHTAKADAEGNWSMKLKPLKAGGPHVLSIKGSNNVVLKDVLVGDVWIGSGQSNMAGGVGGYAKGDEVLAELADGTYPQLRLCRGKGAAWQQSTPPTAPRMSPTGTSRSCCNRCPKENSSAEKPRLVCGVACCQAPPLPRHKRNRG